MAYPDPERGGIEEQVFDVSDWGDRVVEPLYASDLEAAAFEPTEAFAELKAKAEEAASDLAD